MNQYSWDLKEKKRRPGTYFHSAMTLDEYNEDTIDFTAHRDVTNPEGSQAYSTLLLGDDTVVACCMWELGEL